MPPGIYLLCLGNSGKDLKSRQQSPMKKNSKNYKKTPVIQTCDHNFGPHSLRRKNGWRRLETWGWRRLKGEGLEGPFQNILGFMLNWWKRDLDFGLKGNLDSVSRLENKGHWVQIHTKVKGCKYKGHLVQIQGPLSTNTRVIEYKYKGQGDQIQGPLSTNTRVIDYKYKSHWLQIQASLSTNTSIIEYKYKGHLVQILEPLSTNTRAIEYKYKGHLVQIQPLSTNTRVSAVRNINYKSTNIKCLL